MSTLQPKVETVSMTTLQPKVETERVSMTTLQPKVETERAGYNSCNLGPGQKSCFTFHIVSSSVRVGEDGLKEEHFRHGSLVRQGSYSVV